MPGMRRPQATTRLDVERRVLTAREVEDLQRRPAEPRDYEHVAMPNTEVWCDGELIAGLYELEEDSAELLDVCRNLPFVRDYRTSGMRTQSVIFGYRPREPLRKDYCGAASLSSDFPHGFAVLDRWASVVERYYREARPDVHAHHEKMVLQDIDSAWRMTDSIFTSGIVNKDTSHHYHKDNGNFAQTWNAMVVLSFDIEGGETVAPELRTAFRYDNRPCVLVFPAESTWHAVQQLRTRGRNGYRFSVVFYSLTGMCKCGTKKEELDRIRKIRTERERRRANREELVEKLYETGTPRSREVIDRMRASGRLEALEQERTLEERIERLKRSTSSRAKQVIRRLERKLAELKKEEAQ